MLFRVTYPGRWITIRVADRAEARAAAELFEPRVMPRRTGARELAEAVLEALQAESAW